VILFYAAVFACRSRALYLVETDQLFLQDEKRQNGTGCSMKTHIALCVILGNLTEILL
jgi:hypothetical protein